VADMPEIPAPTMAIFSGWQSRLKFFTIPLERCVGGSTQGRVSSTARTGAWITATGERY
jgi:hypothetical protein